MRAARPTLVALIGIAAVLTTAAPALAATAGKLNLSASHGTGGASVTATFSYPGSWGWFGPNCSGPVTFGWDGRSIAKARPGWSSGSCSASVTITPPSSATGPHAVKASAPNVGSATATYTVDRAPAPAVSTPSAPQSSPSPAAPKKMTADEMQVLSTARSAQPSPSGRSAQPSQSARPTPSAGSPSPAAAAVPVPSDSAAPAGPGSLVALDAPAVVVRPVASTPLGVWVLLAGGALILVGAVLVGAVRLFRTKKRVAFSV